MARDWYYRPGDYYQLDDLSGFKIRASRSRKIPGGQTGGLIVDPKRWEPQHPQDFVRGVVDDQTVPEPRSRQTNRYMVVATFATAFSPRQSNLITVDSIEGFTIGDLVAVMLDNGENFYATVIRAQGHDLRFTPELPHTVGSNLGSPLENTVLNMGRSPYPPYLTDDAGVPITDEDGNLFSINK